MSNPNSPISIIIESNGERFIRKTYMGISVLVRERDGYINATKVGNDNGKEVRHYFRGGRWIEVEEYWLKLQENSTRVNHPVFEKRVKYELDEGFSSKVAGFYCHPRLIHFVAEWADLAYAFAVEDIINSVDAVVHSELEREQLEDTVENVAPIIEKVKKTLREELIEKRKEAKEDSYKERYYMASLLALDEHDNIDERMFEEQMKRLDWKMW
jgi:hypothetical protein